MAKASTSTQFGSKSQPTDNLNDRSANLGLFEPLPADIFKKVIEKLPNIASVKRFGFASKSVQNAIIDFKIIQDCSENQKKLIADFSKIILHYQDGAILKIFGEENYSKEDAYFLALNSMNQLPFFDKNNFQVGAQDLVFLFKKLAINLYQTIKFDKKSLGSLTYERVEKLLKNPSQQLPKYQDGDLKKYLQGGNDFRFELLCAIFGLHEKINIKDRNAKIGPKDFSFLCYLIRYATNVGLYLSADIGLGHLNNLVSLQYLEKLDIFGARIPFLTIELLSSKMLKTLKIENSSPNQQHQNDHIENLQDKNLPFVHNLEHLEIVDIDQFHIPKFITFPNLLSFRLDTSLAQSTDFPCLQQAKKLIPNEETIYQCPNIPENHIKNYATADQPQKD